MIETPIRNPGRFETSADLFAKCHETVLRLKDLHCRDDDLPPLLVEAAAFYDMALIACGLRNWTLTTDMNAPLVAAARFLERLAPTAELTHLHDDFVTLSYDVGALTPREAFAYTQHIPDVLTPAQSEFLHETVHTRFDWIAGQDDREHWIMDAFEDAARALDVDTLFEQGATGEESKNWWRTMVAEQPDYLQRRDAKSDLIDVFSEFAPDATFARADACDLVLFDLLAEKGLRRVDRKRLKLRKVNGKISHSPSAAYYDHHERFHEVDLVWLIETTGAQQIYFADPAAPSIEDAIKKDASEINHDQTAFHKEQIALAQARERRRKVSAGKLPTRAMMSRIRNWLSPSP